MITNTVIVSVTVVTSEAEMLSESLISTQMAAMAKIMIIHR